MSSQQIYRVLKTTRSTMWNTEPREGLIIPEKQAKKIILHRCEWSAAVLQKQY